MRFILIGAPGSGKGTQAQLLKEHFKITHLSTGDMLRSAAAAGTEMGKLVDEIMQSGSLVPDEIVINLIKERLDDEATTTHGFLMDGFPRTLAQAEALDLLLEKRATPLDRVIHFIVPDHVILERVTGRRTDLKTGKTFHVKFNPPPPELANQVIQRVDDQEDVVKHRLEQYHQETSPLLPYYNARGIVRTVNGVGKPADVFQAIIKLVS